MSIEIQEEEVKDNKTIFLLRIDETFVCEDYLDFKDLLNLVLDLKQKYAKEFQIKRKIKND